MYTFVDYAGIEFVFSCHVSLSEEFVYCDITCASRE